MLAIFYTERAKETLTSVHLFIEGKFGVKTAIKFLLKADKIVKLIADQPYIFRTSSFENSVRVALISKQTSMYYRVTEDAIHLLFFWDNRQDPF